MTIDWVLFGQSICLVAAAMVAAFGWAGIMVWAINRSRVLAVAWLSLPFFAIAFIMSVKWS